MPTVIAKWPPGGSQFITSLWFSNTTAEAYMCLKKYILAVDLRKYRIQNELFLIWWASAAYYTYFTWAWIRNFFWCLQTCLFASWYLSSSNQEVQSQTAPTTAPPLFEPRISKSNCSDGRIDCCSLWWLSQRWSTNFGKCSCLLSCTVITWYQ